MAKYYCMECKKEIRRGSIRCKSCENKRRAKLGIFKGMFGEANPSFKGGKPKCINCGQEVSNYGIKRCWNCCIKSRKIPENNPMFGIHRFGEEASHYIDGKSIKESYCLDCGIKITSEAERCLSCSTKYLYKIGKLDNNGRKFSKETKRKMSLSLGGTGIPYEFSNYPGEFFKVRVKILERDNYICQNCGMTEEEHLIVIDKTLEVHHIDYNKNNNNEDNLLTLCRQCNIRANFNRDYWQNYYKNKIGVINGAISSNS